ncbi:mycothiol transferase [Streptomyces silvisoli]|uniref:DUF664 domain-containing protein n=1 Tax=Streptomyces silvisoli TaxID=3034235 RepID=A0ABT5ZE00_9ACTN|nr:DUF664 domain-containing protein [Streptomyces silvisoli]MDF3288060.1 DUF664 domain-containing protein [Streptomyces silvisoli]
MTTPRRKAEIFVGAGPDRRFEGPATGDERHMLVAFLGAHRATLELKCAGVAEELSRRSAAPSTLSLLGLVRPRGTVSLRWVLIHMIEEYARHNGHADLLRERIDGAVGV